MVEQCTEVMKLYPPREFEGVHPRLAVKNMVTALRANPFSAPVIDPIHIDQVDALSQKAIHHDLLSPSLGFDLREILARALIKGNDATQIHGMRKHGDDYFRALIHLINIPFCEVSVMLDSTVIDRPHSNYNVIFQGREKKPKFKFLINTS